MMNELMKYEFTDHHQAVPLFNKTIMVTQIKALRDIPSIGVKKGDVGGHISSSNALSHYGDAWVFPGSIVHSGGRVNKNAVVSGNSIIASNGIVEGDAHVEDSSILGDSIIGGEATVESSRITEGCLITGDIQLKNAQLERIIANKGQITDSMIRSTKESLHIEKAALITQTRLTIHDESPVMESQATLENVTAEGLAIFRLLGRTRLVDVTFPKETRLFVDLPDDEMNYSIIESTEGDCEFEKLDLHLTNSLIRGAVYLKGRLKIKDSMLFENASVRNKGDRFLTLSEVKLRELATIRYDGRHVAKGINSVSIQGDAVVTL